MYLAQIAENPAEIAASDVNGLEGAAVTASADADGFTMLYTVVGCDGRLLSFEAYAEDGDGIRRAEKLLGRITQTVQYTGAPPHAEPFRSAQIAVQYPDGLAAAFQNVGEQDSVLGLTFVNAQTAAEQNCQFMVTAENSADDPSAAAKQMQDLWTEMKSAEDKNTNRWFVPLFLISCFAIIIVVLIRRHIKSKRDIF